MTEEKVAAVAETLQHRIMAISRQKRRELLQHMGVQVALYNDHAEATVE